MTRENLTPEVGMYANFCGYTDMDAYEIVRVISKKTIEIRHVTATLVEGWKPDMVVGGFCAHTINNDTQDYNYKSDLDAPVVRIRKRKDGRWYCKSGGRHSISDYPRKFHDYNF